jgi:hypothetical protein
MIGFLQADDCGAKKPGVLLCRYFGNMGGVQAAGTLSFILQ